MSDEPNRFFFRHHYERLARGWSQRELATRTGIRSSDISAAERGRLNLRGEELDRLAQAFNIRPASVLAQKIGPSLFVDGQVIRTPESDVEGDTNESGQVTARVP